MKIYDRDLRKVKIEKELNNEIRFRGMRKPPCKIKVKAKKYDNDIVRVELVDIPTHVKFTRLREEKAKLDIKKKVKAPEEIKKPEEEPKEEPKPEESEETKEKKEASKEETLEISKQQAKTMKHISKEKPVTLKRKALSR